MKSLEWVLSHMDELETTLDDRVGRRLVQFASDEQLKELGYTYTGEEKRTVVEWNEENIIKQLRDDVEFGIEKATNHRGISSSLMYEVCNTWCKILENDLVDCDYGWNGHNMFQKLDEKYNLGLNASQEFSGDFFEEW
jgi:hypothetical protein